MTTHRCIFSFFVVVIVGYSWFCFTKLPGYSNPQIDIDISGLGRRNNVDLRIIVLTFNRPQSLKRLLRSLNDAYYFNDTVVLEIWIDRSNDGNIHTETFLVASTVPFDKGEKSIYNHSKNVGLYGQWMGTWQPSEIMNEIGIIFEDDVSVSPWFYHYLKIVHQKYQHREDINGYSLQINIKHGKKNGILNVSQSNNVFLYPVIGTSGFSPKKNNWIKFTNWYTKRNKYTLPLVPEIYKPTQWYKQFLIENKTHTMWTMWHIYFAHKNKEWTLYPNLPKNQAFSINWMEKGLHLDKTIRLKGDIKLLKDWEPKLNKLPENPIFIDTDGDQIL